MSTSASISNISHTTQHDSTKRPKNSDEAADEKHSVYYKEGEMFDHNDSINIINKNDIRFGLFCKGYSYHKQGTMHLHYQVMLSRDVLGSTVLIKGSVWNVIKVNYQEKKMYAHRENEKYSWNLCEPHVAEYKFEPHARQSYRHSNYDSKWMECKECDKVQQMQISADSNFRYPKKSVFVRCFTCENYICLNCPEEKIPLCQLGCKFGRSFTYFCGPSWYYAYYCPICLKIEENKHKICHETHNGKRIKIHCAKKCSMINKSNKII